VAHVRIRSGRTRAPEPRTRGAALSAALVAAGEPPLLTTYEWTQGGPCDRIFAYTALSQDFAELSSAGWPSEEPSLIDFGVEPTFRDGGEAVYRLADGSVAYVAIRHGWFQVKVAGATQKAVHGHLAAFQALYPPTYMEATSDRVPITFWTLGPYGPVHRLRMIDSAPWDDVEANYPAETRDELLALMRSFEPGKTGQLLLWQGPPGTGKTWALRALASEWLPWAEFHYITDPDAFFVESPTYMVDVLLAETYSVLSEDGNIYEETDEDGKWRVLILEDTGELLSATAKEKYGQGLRVLCLVTTNDELGELNPAVRRPGRCAAQIVFPPFPADEASAWLGEEVTEPLSVAELYERRGAGETPLAPDDEAVVASVVPDVVAQIRAVADAHSGEAAGYGETAWDADRRRVLYVCGDWTEVEPIEADFLAIDGVDEVVFEPEALPTGWWEADVVYPDRPPRWVLRSPESEAAAQADALALASQPFDA
jgi:hypothetical protein